MVTRYQAPKELIEAIDGPLMLHEEFEKLSAQFDSDFKGALADLEKMTAERDAANEDRDNWREQADKFKQQLAEEGSAHATEVKELEQQIADTTANAQNQRAIADGFEAVLEQLRDAIDTALPKPQPTPLEQLVKEFVSKLSL